MVWRKYIWHRVLRRPYKLAVRLDNGVGQTVVFLHGLAATGESWKYAASLLDPEKFRVIVIDLLGFGDSPQPEWIEYSVRDHAQAVSASLNRLGVKDPIILVGHSMGSLVASYIARKSSKKVKHLILYQMPVYGELPNAVQPKFRRKAYLRTYQYLLEHPKMTLRYAKVLGGIASDYAGFNLDSSSWRPFEMSLKNTVIEQESIDWLKTLSIRVDIVYGTYDILVLRKHIQKYLSSNPNIHFHKINDTHRISKRAASLISKIVTSDLP